MTARRQSPLHDFWHRKVEGQIRHTIGQHPSWFLFKDERERRNCIDSLAKRIVGEIVVVVSANDATRTAGVAANCVGRADGFVLGTCETAPVACDENEPPARSESVATTEGDRQCARS